MLRSGDPVWVRRIHGGAGFREVVLTPLASGSPSGPTPPRPRREAAKGARVDPDERRIGQLRAG